MIRTAPLRRRRGFVIGLVVFAGLLFLALAIYPTLFFSGSQTRSEALSANRWRGRVLARGGLKLGANMLRKERWWETPEGNDDDSIGTKTSEELGVPSTAGRFDLVAQALPGPLPFPIPEHLLPDDGGLPYNPVERIDLFVRAEIEDDTVVAYGAFVMSPRPRYQSRDSILPGGTARLVRVQFFTRPEHQAIEDSDVRDAIREAVKEQADLFLKNYVAVDFRATPGAAATGPMSDSDAMSFMEQWLASDAGSVDRYSDFLRDRLFDMLFEGTPVGRRDDARFERELTATVKSCREEDDPELAKKVRLAKFLCDNDMDGDCTWYEPACETPEEWNYSPDDAAADETVLHLREQDLADEEGGASVDAGYIGRLVSTPKILRQVDVSCDVVEYLDREDEPPDADGDGVYENSAGENDPSVTWDPLPAPSGPGVNLPEEHWIDVCTPGDPNDQCFCVNPQGSVEDPPSASVAYELTDPVTGYQQPLFEAASYFQRQLLEQGVTADSGEVNFQVYRTGTPVLDDDDDDGPPNIGDDDDDGGLEPGDDAEPIEDDGTDPPEDDGGTDPPEDDDGGGVGGTGNLSGGGLF